MVAEMVRSFSELERFKEAWDRLAVARPVPEVFHTFEWARAWWRGHSGGHEVFCPIVRGSDGEVVAIWPLVRHNSEIRALGHGVSDHNDLLAKPENAQAAVRTALDLLAATGQTWRTGVIDNVSERGILLAAARAVGDLSATRLEILRRGKGWAAVADGPDHFLKLARKESLRRHRRKLEKFGRVTFRHVEDSEEIKTHLTAFRHQHIVRWALSGTKSDFLDAASGRYYSALAECLSADRYLRFAVLEVDGKPVAYHLGFEAAGRYVWCRPSFDVDLWDLGPGEVLLQSVLQYCAASHMRELDFTIGDEPYKDRFSNVTYDYFRIHLFSRRSLEQYVLRAREHIKGHPWLFSWMKSHWVWGKELVERIAPVLKRDGFVEFSRRHIRQMVRALVFRRDEVIVFRSSLENKGRWNRFAPAIEVVPLRLSLLAESALHRPAYLAPVRLASFRKRIAANDRGVVALYGGKLAHVAWVGRRGAIVAGSETGPNCVLPLPKEVSVIYDCWTPDEFRGMGVYPSVLQSLVREEAEFGREVWIYCLCENFRSRAGILKAGFAEAAHMVRIVWFHRWERCRVISNFSGELAP